MAEIGRVYGPLPARYPRNTRLFPAGDPYRHARADHMAGKVDTIHPHPSQRAAIAITAAPLDCSRPTRDRRRQRRPGRDRIAFDAAPSAPAVAGHLRRSDAEEPDAFPATAKRVAVDRDQHSSEHNRHYQHGYGSKRSALASISSARTEASLDLSKRCSSTRLQARPALTLASSYPVLFLALRCAAATNLDCSQICAADPLPSTIFKRFSASATGSEQAPTSAETRGN